MLSVASCSGAASSLKTDHSRCGSTAVKTTCNPEGGAVTFASTCRLELVEDAFRRSPAPMALCGARRVASGGRRAPSRGRDLPMKRSLFHRRKLQRLDAVLAEESDASGVRCIGPTDG